MICRVSWLVFAMAWCLVATARAEERPSWQVAVVLDQSCSMNSSDPARNALIGTSILADLMGPGDRLTVHPQYGAGLLSSGGPTIALDVTRRGDFRAALEGLGATATDSQFQAAFDQARNDLTQRTSHFDEQLLVQIYDGDRPASSPLDFRDALTELAGTGAHRYLVGAGASASRQHVFADYGPDHRSLVRTSGELLDAWAVALARLLHARTLPRGAGPPSFRVDVPEGTAGAWLVVLADDEVRSVRAASGHPPAGRVAPVDGSGWTLPTAQGIRSYRVLHLASPTPGTWAFEASTTASRVEYLLLPWFDVRLHAELVGSTPTAGGETEIVVRGDGTIPDDLDVEARVQGHVIPLTRRGDGSWGGRIPTPTDGPLQIEVVGANDHLEARETLLVDVQKADGAFDCTTMNGEVLPVGSPVLLSTTSVGRLAAPITRAWAEIDGQTLPLTDDGAGADRGAGDGTWTGRFVPSRVGPVDVVLWNEIAGVARSCTARMDVRPVVVLAAQASSAPTVGPCGADTPSNDVAATDCGDAGCCTGASLAVSLEGTRASHPWTAELSLEGGLPWGVEVHLASMPYPEGRLVPGRPVTVPVDPGTRELPLRVCIHGCPSAGTFDPLTTLRLRAPGAYSPGPDGVPILDGPGIAVPLGATIVASSFLRCWGWYLLVATVALLVALVIWGIVRPVRFPRPGSMGSIPSTVAVFALDTDRRGRTLPPPEPLTWIALRKRSRRSFWRHERLAFDAGYLEPIRWRRGERATLQLARSAAGPEARLRVHQGTAYTHRFQPGMPIDRYPGDWEPVPAEGIRVTPDTIVYLEEAQRCLVFSHLGG